jgi:hemerythrin-like domain-containing protein
MLEDEHKLILRMVRALPVIQQRIENGDVDPEILLTVVDFFQVYADISHHTKEEAALFPLLAKRGVPLKGCPMGTLHNEHDQGRILMKALGDAVQRYMMGDSDAKRQIAEYLKGATDFYTDHIWKEDYLLFPMSRKVLNDSDEEELRKEFVRVDSKFGDHFQEEYHYHISRLESILNGDGKINHPSGDHTRPEDSAHLITKLEQILHA